MTFPTNIPSVTIWEKTVVDRAAAYIRHETGAAYWQDNRGQTQGREEDDSIFLAIHADAITDGYIPKADDRILSGSVTGDVPPRNAYTVGNVKDLRFGSYMMQHIEVILK
jgi:hypothetical protein